MIAPIVFVAVASAAGLSVDVDTRELREGQTIGLRVVVSDASVRGVPPLRVPDGLEVQYQGQSQARTILNFESTTTTTFRYALTALRRGSYTLGPYEVTTSAGALRASPLTLEVGARASGGSSDQLVSELGVERAWVGQTVVLRARFQTDKALVQARWSPPTSDGFTPETGIEPQVSEGRISEDGKPLSVQELLVALHASRAGKQSVPGPILQAQFVVARSRRGGADPLFDELARFGDVRGEVYAGEARTLDVRPLPSEGRPADFAGLVGSFALEVKPSTTTLAVGETLTLEVALRGDGALTGFTLPAASVDGFKIYDDQPVVSSAFVDGAYHAEAHLKRALVALAPGTYTIPAVTVSTFDPVKGAWATVRSEPIAVSVTGSAAAPSVASYAGPASTAVDTLAEDILPVRTEASVRARTSPWWSLSLLVPGGLLLVAEALRGLRDRPRRVAEVRAMGVADLPSDPEARVGAWERLLRERAGARLGIAPDALRREDLAGLGPLAERADAAWRALEGARYGGGAALSEEELRSVVEALA